MTVVEPTGMDSGNAASPSALIPLAQKALANPVIAEIVAKQSVDLPGAGHVENTNGLLADPGVLGLKTGTLDGWNLLSAKDVADRRHDRAPVRVGARPAGRRGAARGLAGAVRPARGRAAAATLGHRRHDRRDRRDGVGRRRSTS